MMMEILRNLTLIFIFITFFQSKISELTYEEVKTTDEGLYKYVLSGTNTHMLVCLSNN